jgi:hypothetical protein
MLRRDIIKKSIVDRKAYELFVLLGGMYDTIMHEVNDNGASLDDASVNDDNDAKYIRVIRNALVTLNEIDFTFFSEVMDLIDFFDKTAVFERQSYTGNEAINHITSILDKMYVQFEWYKDIKGMEMSNEEIVELLSYDCNLDEFVQVAM